MLSVTKMLILMERNGEVWQMKVCSTGRHGRPVPGPTFDASEDLFAVTSCLNTFIHDGYSDPATFNDGFHGKLSGS